MALNDSLLLRDQQLSIIKNVMITNQDTVFETDYIGSEISQPPQQRFQQEIQQQGNSDLDFSTPTLDANNIIGSRLLDNSVSFPAPWPVDGTLTRTFEPENQHFGIDIASSEGALISSIADGIVMTSVWTMNYGYVLQIQHAGGYTSVYKHCSLPLKKEGDTVLRGDIIGIIGESGLISSGPHVHIELWRNGIALDPELFLISNS
jgi:murein DD-endopeptidase MepM/ murein hydrolase activator NlpD